ncbi:hypothetical protein [Iodidimonas sp. SYSU 1G8]|uniref:hypothetical protein n=1 Tax=Iodidimonas sp. SYSU 1G8 TaxID=3133967 RepID=UPI0031FED2FB
MEWADHVSPSFRRWVQGGDVVAAPPADPAIRNRPDAEQTASDLNTVENARERVKTASAGVPASAAATRFLKRISRSHARAIVGPEGALMGAELADGIQMTPLTRSRSKGTLFDRSLPDAGAPPKLAQAPLPGPGPLQDMPAPETYDGAPLFGMEGDQPREKGYTLAVRDGAVIGMELGDHVSVVHVSRFAKGEAPDSGEVAIYPRSRYRPFGPINSFEHLDPFLAINVEPLQTAADPSDPAPVARSAYAIGFWDLPGDVPMPLSDKSMYEFRDRLIADQRDPRNCCGPTRITVMHNPLAIAILPNSFNSMPGQTAQVVPLAPGMPAW